MQDASDSLIASAEAALAGAGALPAAGSGDGPAVAHSNPDPTEVNPPSVPTETATTDSAPASTAEPGAASSPPPSGEPASRSSSSNLTHLRAIPAATDSAELPPAQQDARVDQSSPVGGVDVRDDADERAGGGEPRAALASAPDATSEVADAVPTPAQLEPAAESTASSSMPVPVPAAPVDPVSLQSSAASTPVIGAALLPAPTPSGSPAPAKKFHSSLSVNKKFLEKATEKGKPDPKAVVARLATPPVVAPVSTSHPRLLTGKISAGTSISLTTAQTVSGVSGWLKNTPAPGAEGAPRPALPSQQDAAGLGRGATYERGRGGMMGAAGIGRGRGGAVWGKSSASGGELNMGIGGDFPTAAEAASAKSFKAAALLEQMQSRDRAVQARAAAAAAANAHLLEGLDAFRGVHLDPNASHWDDDAEDDDFLDETIEFGDGTQYKIQDAHLEPPASGRDPNALLEPHPSEFATREAPLAPGESGAHEGGREERFKDDFDRSWPKRPVAADPKSIFNERLGKFELAGGAPKKGAPGPILTHDGERPSHARAPSGSEHSNASVTSPRLDKAALPPLSGRREPPASAWGRGEPAREWHAAGSAPTARRPSMEPQPRGRRPSNEPSARRPSVSTVVGIDPGGRQLPPHLAVAQSAAQPPARNSHDRPAGPPPAHHAHPPSHSHAAQPISPASATLSPPQLQKMVLPSLSPIEPADTVVPAPMQAPPPPPPVVDLEALHVREMHAAAERAKKRRQDEEIQRLEQVERAKKKAAEIEEKIRVAAEAKVAEAAAKLPSPKSATAPKPVTAARPAPESWRERVASGKAQAPASTPVSVGPAPVQAPSKPEPTQILARDPKSPTTAPAKDPARPPFPKRTSSGPPQTDERAWRRGDAVPAPAAEPPKTSNRQLPPHLANQAPPAAAPLPPAAPSTTARVEPAPNAPLAPIEVPTTLDVPATSPSVPNTEVAPPQIARKGSVGSVTAVATAALAIKGAAFKKVPQISSFEDTMSRIKGAMGQPKEPAQDHVETVQREHKSPIAIPTVKLPTTTLSLATALVTSAGHRSASASEPTPRGPKAAMQSKKPPTGPKLTRAEAKKAAANALPAFENREAMPLFDCSRIERPGSPPPAWKAYVIRLAEYPKLSYPRHKAVKAFNNPHEPARVQSLSVVPQQHGGGGRRGQQDLFHPSFTKGKINYTVLLSATRITRRTSIEMLPVSAFAPPPRKAAEPTPSRAPEGSWRRDGAPTNGADEPLTAVLESEDMLDATTAPPAASLFDPGPPRPTRAVKDKVPPGASIAFYRPPSVTPLEQAGASKMFMVTSELDGEVVEMTPREFLAAPGADVAIQAPELTSTPPNDVPATTQALSPLSNGAWPSKTPLTMSVLDPTAPSVWSAPPTDSPVHARAVSLGGIQPENSLQGIADPDDFPAASIPTSLAELKSEDEGSSDGKPVVHKQAAKDEARLRAAAPSFSSYNELPSPHIESRTPRYPSFQRSPSYPQLQPSQSPVNYPQTFLPNSAYAQQQQQASQSHMYSSFSPQPQSSAPLYGAPMHQGFGGQGAFAAPPQLSSPQFSSYRAPNPINNTITNPALIAQGYGQNLSSYGPVGAASAFGPVGGAGGARNGSALGAFRSPSMTPNYLQGTYAQQQHPYRGDYAGQDARQQQPFGASPSAYGAQPLYHQPPQPYGGAGFSPQLQPMQAPGRGGPTGPAFRRF